MTNEERIQKELEERAVEFAEFVLNMKERAEQSAEWEKHVKTIMSNRALAKGERLRKK